MHLTNQCTGSSENAMNGIQEINLNILLICIGCLGTKQRDVAIDCLAKGRTSALNEGKLTSFDKAISCRQESVDKLSAMSHIKMTYSDAAQIAQSFVDSTTSEVCISIITEFKSSNRSQKASRMDMITHEEKSKIGTLNHCESSDFLNTDRLDKFEENSSRPRSVLIKLNNIFIASKLLSLPSMLQSFKGVFHEKIIRRLSPGRLKKNNTN